MPFGCLVEVECTAAVGDVVPKVIETGGSPYYSGGQVVGGILYAAGQVAATGNKTPEGKPEIFGKTAAEQTQKTLLNLMKIVEEAGSSVSKVLKTTCYLSDINDYAAFNEVYLKFFPDEATRPARV